MCSLLSPIAGSQVGNIETRLADQCLQDKKRPPGHPSYMAPPAYRNLTGLLQCMKHVEAGSMQGARAQ